MRPTSATYFLVACLSLVELSGCGGDDAGPLFGVRDTEDAGGKGSGGSSGSSAGSTSGGSSGVGGASGSGGGSGTAGAAGTVDAGSGGTAGEDQDGAAGAAGASGGGAVSGDAALDSTGCPQPTTYFRDADKDGFGDAHTSIRACQLPDGYSSSDKDCYDDNADAKPGQTGWFTKHRGDGSYDYDCNGTGVRRWTGTGSCPLALCTVITGWQGTTIPNCGDNGQWVAACTMFPLCEAKTETRSQECH